MTTANTVSNLSAMTVAQLREFASDNNIVVTGDRRRKASYVASISTWLEVQEAECPDAFGEAALNEHDAELAHEMAIAEGLIEPECPTNENATIIAGLMGWEYCAIYPEVQEEIDNRFFVHDNVSCQVLADMRGWEYCTIPAKKETTTYVVDERVHCLGGSIARTPDLQDSIDELESDLDCMGNIAWDSDDQLDVIYKEDTTPAFWSHPVMKFVSYIAYVLWLLVRLAQYRLRTRLS